MPSRVLFQVTAYAKSCVQKESFKPQYHPYRKVTRVQFFKAFFLAYNMEQAVAWLKNYFWFSNLSRFVVRRLDQDSTLVLLCGRILLFYPPRVIGKRCSTWSHHIVENQAWF